MATTTASPSVARPLPSKSPAIWEAVQPGHWEGGDGALAGGDGEADDGEDGGGDGVGDSAGDGAVDGGGKSSNKLQ